MNLRKAFTISGMLLATVALLGLTACEDKPTETPFPQLKPKVTVTGVEIVAGATRIYATGFDEDGEVDWYAFSLDGVLLADSVVNSVYETMVNYDDPNAEYTVSVIGTDNDGQDSDPGQFTFSPAKIATSNKPPTTTILAPVSGAVTSQGVVVQWDARDPDGVLAAFEIKFNTGPWIEVDGAERSYTKTGLTPGTQTVQVRAKDNVGAYDPTPAIVPYTVQAGLSPILTINHVADGATFFVSPGASVDLLVGWSGDAGYYNGDVDHFEYAIDGGTFTETTDADYTFAGLVKGNYVIDVKIIDIGGNETQSTINVEVTEPTLANEVLFVNGVHWGTYQANLEVSYPSFLGSATAEPWDYWDLFGAPVGGYPAGMNINEVGTGAIGGATIGSYKAIVWSGNFYSPAGPSDLDYWNPALIAGYLKAGGKLILHTRRTGSFFNAELQSMAHVNGFLADLTGTITSMAPTAEGSALGLNTINFAGSSSSSGFTGVDGSEFVEVLYAEGGDDTYLTGIRSQANEDGVWNLVVLCGRQYRITNPDDMRADYYTFLTDMFGVTPPALP